MHELSVGRSDKLAAPSLADAFPLRQGITFHQALLEICPAPSGSMFGEKADGEAARRKEASFVSRLMAAKRPFCFLRMGDMELVYLLAEQYKQLNQIEFGDGPMSGTQGYANPGLSAKHAERLRKAYEEADYVDFHEKNWPNEHLVPRLILQRAPDSYRNPTKEASLVFLAWTESEFKQYCQDRRVGFAAAEARVLELLSQTPEFRRAATNYWPEKTEIFYHQVRNDGRDLDANLDLVKEDLREFVKEHRLDTLFLSLGGGAKILGYELSRELGICCFDFGAMIRAFTYSGCDGNRVARSPHSPFFFRIPFETHMDALEQAFPNLTSAELLAKAHGQLLLEVMKREVGWTFASWEFDFSEENRMAFQKAYQVYRTRYQHLFKASLETRKERAGFLHFCGTRRLTLEGRIFILWFRLKGWVRRSIRFIAK
jgi:hypothetical protein